jgi:hypothetical protein
MKVVMSSDVKALKRSASGMKALRTIAASSKTNRDTRVELRDANGKRHSVVMKVVNSKG